VCALASTPPIPKGSCSQQPRVRMLNIPRPNTSHARPPASDRRLRQRLTDKGRRAGHHLLWQADLCLAPFPPAWKPLLGSSGSTVKAGAVPALNQGGAAPGSCWLLHAHAWAGAALAAWLAAERCCCCCCCCCCCSCLPCSSCRWCLPAASSARSWRRRSDSAQSCVRARVVCVVRVSACVHPLMRTSICIHACAIAYLGGTSEAYREGRGWGGHWRAQHSRPHLRDLALHALPVRLLALALQLGGGRPCAGPQQVCDGVVHHEAAHWDACARACVCVCMCVCV